MVHKPLTVYNQILLRKAAQNWHPLFYTYFGTQIEIVQQTSWYKNGIRNVHFSSVRTISLLVAPDLDWRCAHAANMAQCHGSYGKEWPHDYRALSLLVVASSVSVSSLCARHARLAFIYTIVIVCVCACVWVCVCRTVALNEGFYCLDCLCVSQRGLFELVSFPIRLTMFNATLKVQLWEFDYLTENNDTTETISIVYIFFLHSSKSS